MTSWEQQAIDDAEAAVWASTGSWSEGIDHCLSLIEPALRFDLGPVAEVGCGIGRLLHPLALRYPDTRFVGQDPTPTMLAKAVAACPDPYRITYQQEPWLLPPAGGLFGAVYSVVTLQHLPPMTQAAVLIGAGACLEAGGRLRVQWTPQGDTGPLCYPVPIDEVLHWCRIGHLDVIDVDPDPLFPTWRWLTAERRAR